MTTIRQLPSARAAILVILASLTAGPLTACYTLVQHPRVASLNYRRPEGKSCSSCHSAREVRSFLEPERLAPDTPPWDSLTHPWWIPPDSTGGDG